MEAWFLHAVGDDRSNIQPGPLPWGLLLLARSALIDLPTIAVFNPSMEEKASNSDSDSDSYSSSENCPN